MPRLSLYNGNAASKENTTISFTTYLFHLDFKKYWIEFLYIIIEKKVFTSQVGREGQQEAEISGKTHSVRKLLITYLGS